MRREQRPATIYAMQIFSNRPGDRQSVKGRCATSNLIEDNKAARGRLIENGRRLNHLRHEG